jgi:hypothetical protein
VIQTVGEGVAHRKRFLHGGGRRSRGDVGEVASQGLLVSIDGPVSSTWTRRSPWVGLLGQGVAGGSRHRWGA